MRDSRLSGSAGRRRGHRKPRGVPRGHSAGHIDDVPVTFAKQKARRHARSVSRPANDVDLAILRNFRKLLRDFAGVDVLCRIDMAALPFGVRTNVQNKGALRQLHVKLGNRNLRKMRLLVTALDPGTHAALEKAFDAIESNPHQRAPRFFHGVLVFADKIDGAVVRNQPAGPESKRRPGAKVDRARNVRSAESLRPAKIDNDRFLFTNELSKFSERNGSRAGQHAEKSGTPRVQTLDAAVVLGKRRHAAENAGHKKIALRNREKWVRVPFVSESGLRALRHPGPTKRTGTVRGKDFEAVGQRSGFPRDAVE